MISHAVAMLDRSGEHVGDGLDSAVRMPWESRQIVLRNIVSEIIEQEERIEIVCVSEAERSPQMHARSFEGWLGFYETLDGPDGHVDLQFN
jgi:hypothetical protein